MTSIEWTHRPGTKGESWNPIRARKRETGAVGWHCTHASEGCRNCYAERLNLNRRGLAFGTGLPYKPGHEADLEIFLDDKTLAQPLRWRQPRTIFVCSMTDLFGAFVPDAMIDGVFAVAALCPQHTFIVLTKRSARMREYFDGRRANFGRASDVLQDLSHPLDETAHQLAADRLDFFDSAGISMRNVWLGVSAERQQEADERIPDLLATPASIRFVSLEPLLGPIDLRRIRHYNPRGLPWIDSLYGLVTHGSYLARSPSECSFNTSTRIPGELPGLNWVIVGGESGPDGRPMHPDWTRSLRDQCAAAGVPFFFKQWGSWASILDRDRDDPDWRKDYSRRYSDTRPDIAWLNLDGGRGFHGERFHIMRRLTKKAAGRLLDGVEHNGWPA